MAPSPGALACGRKPSATTRRKGCCPDRNGSAGGYRLYGASDLERLSFIRRARDLGFRLESVRRLLGLADRRVDTCNEVRELAGAHLAEVRAKLADLRRMERVLTELVRACKGGTVPECLLLEALASGARSQPRTV